ncbi:MAG TPA: signal peptidase I, partial [Actinomycetota bacterium]|nr:signal peptidase I [Actinomycetota bacterium]
DGTRLYSITSIDLAGNTRTQSNLSVGVDNTAPFASDIQTANGGGTAGRAEAGDTITFTFSEQIDPQSVLAGWTGTSTNVVVRLIDGGCTLNLLVKVCSNDSFDVRNASNSATLPLGSVNLNNSDYHGGGLIGTSSPLTFGATGTPSTMVQSGSVITITLGTGSDTADTGGTTTMTWSPSTVPFDAAGNNMSSASRNEQGASDREF